MVLDDLFLLFLLGYSLLFRLPLFGGVVWYIYRSSHIFWGDTVCEFLIHRSPILSGWGHHLASSRTAQFESIECSPYIVEILKLEVPTVCGEYARDWLVFAWFRGF